MVENKYMLNKFSKNMNISMYYIHEQVSSCSLYILGYQSMKGSLQKFIYLHVWIWIIIKYMLKLQEYSSYTTIKKANI